AIAAFTPTISLSQVDVQRRPRHANPFSCFGHINRDEETDYHAPLITRQLHDINLSLANRLKSGIKSVKNGQKPESGDISPKKTEKYLCFEDMRTQNHERQRVLAQTVSSHSDPLWLSDARRNLDLFLAER